MTMIEKLAKAIHDTDDMCDTVWPDSDDDTGYRGGSGYVRLCKHPELYRNAARAVLTALREPELILRDDQGVIHEVRGAPADFFRMCIDHILQEADRD